MSFTITSRGVSPTSFQLRSGRVDVYVGVTVSNNGQLLRNTIVFDWTDAPEGGRISQILILHGFIVGRDGSETPIQPHPPETNVAALGGRQQFCMSREAGSGGQAMNHWAVDAVRPRPRSRTDPARAYTTHPSHPYTDRGPSGRPPGRRLRYYDSPMLMFNNPRAAVVSAGASLAAVHAVLLRGTFQSAFWRESECVGVVEWVCRWNAGGSDFSSRDGPNYRSVRLLGNGTPPSPTAEQTQLMIQQWGERRREQACSPSTPESPPSQR